MAEAEWEIVGEGGGGGKPSGALNAADVAFFQKTFSLPEESPVHRCLCSMNGTQGWVYLSRRHVCFSGLLGRVVVLALRDVLGVAPESRRVGKGLVLRLDGEKECVLFAPFGGGTLFDMLNSLWLQSKEQDVTLAEGHERSDVLDLLVARGQAAAAARPFRDPKAEKEFREYVKDGAFELVEVFRKRFSLVLEGKHISGSLFLSQVIAFVAEQFVWTIHVLDILSIDCSDGGVVRLLLKDDMMVEFVAQNAGDCAHDVLLLRGVWRSEVEKQAALKRPPPMRTMAFAYFTGEMMENGVEFSKSYGEWTAARSEAWKSYLLRYGRGSYGRLCQQPFYKNGRRCGANPIRKTPEWDLLIREGIPDEFRAEVWLHASGAATMMAANPGLYAQLVQDATQRQFLAARDISKDVDRTMPTHPFYQTREGLESLQRVLSCYALHNPKIGYTQSMNFLSALFLLYMSEEMAFYMLATVCEHIAPHAYRKSMVGSVAQLVVLDRLLEKHCNNLYLSLSDKGFACSMVATGWLMCLFITFLPWELCLRILDNYLCGSSTVLFRVALAIFVVNENRLLECDGIEDVLKVLHRRDYAVEQLLTTAFCLFEVTDAELSRMLIEETAKAIRNAANDGETRKLSKTQHATRFTAEETRLLYARFCQVLSPEAAAGMIGEKEFCAAVVETVPRWDGVLAKLVFDETKKQSAGQVTFEELARSLSTLQKGSVEEKLLFCLTLFGDEAGIVDAVGVTSALRAFFSLFGCCLEVAEIERVASAGGGSGAAQTLCDNIVKSGLLKKHGLEGGEAESEVGDFAVL